MKQGFNHLAGLAVLAAAMSFAPSLAAAQQTSSTPLRTVADLLPDSPRTQKHISFRLTQEDEPAGKRSGSRILAGTAISPNATAGVGLFERLPRDDSAYKDEPTSRPKRSRKAGLGISLRF